MARRAKAAGADEDVLAHALAMRVLPPHWEDALRHALAQRPQWLLAGGRVCDIASLAPEDRRTFIARTLLEYAAGCTAEQAAAGAVQEALECAVLCAGVVPPDAFASALMAAPPGPVRNAMLRHTRTAVGRADASAMFEALADAEDAQLALLCGGVSPPEATALSTLLRLVSRMDCWAHLSSILACAAGTAYIAADAEAVARLSEHLDVHVRARHLVLCADAPHSLADVFRCVSRLAPPQAGGTWGALVALLLDRDAAALPQPAVSAALAALVSHDCGAFVIRVAERRPDLLLPCLNALLQRGQSDAFDESVTAGARQTGGLLDSAVSRLLEACACRTVRGGTPSERETAWAVLEGLPVDALLAERTVVRLLLDQVVLECGPAQAVRLYALVLRAAVCAQSQRADGSLWRELQMQWRKQLASHHAPVAVLGAAGLVALAEHCAAEIDAPQRLADMPGSSQAPPPAGLVFPESACALLFADVFEGVVAGTATADASALVWLAGALSQRTRPDAPSNTFGHGQTPGLGAALPADAFKLPLAKTRSGNGRRAAGPCESSFPSAPKQLPQGVLAYMRRRVSRAFETRWVRETAKLSSATLSAAVLTGAIDEPAVCVDLRAAPEAVCATFVLLQALEKAVHAGGLENVDALLGCPVLLPRGDDDGSTCEASMSDGSHLTSESRERLGAWLCCLVNAFSDQDDADVREKAVRRLRALHDLLTDPVASGDGGATAGRTVAVEGIPDACVAALVAVASSVQTKSDSADSLSPKHARIRADGAKLSPVLEAAALTTLAPHASDVCSRLFVLATSLSAWSVADIVGFCTAAGAGAAHLEVAERCVAELYARRDVHACDSLAQLVASRSAMSDASRPADPRRMLRIACMASDPGAHVDDALLSSALAMGDAETVGLLCRLGTRTPWDALSSAPEKCAPARRPALHDAVLAGLAGHCASVASRAAPLPCLELRALLGVLEAAVQRCRASDCPAAMRASLLRHGRAVLHALFVAVPPTPAALPPAVSALHAQLASPDGAAAVRLLQQCTRGLHIICNHHKNDRPPSRLPALIAPVRRTLEALIFAVRRMLQTAGALDAFWMGNLKHRALDGSEVCSQLDPVH